MLKLMDIKVELKKKPKYLDNTLIIFSIIY